MAVMIVDNFGVMRWMLNETGVSVSIEGSWGPESLKITAYKFLLHFVAAHCSLNLQQHPSEGG